MHTQGKGRGKTHAYLNQLKEEYEKSKRMEEEEDDKSSVSSSSSSSEYYSANGGANAEEGTYEVSLDVTMEEATSKAKQMFFDYDYDDAPSKSSKDKFMSQKFSIARRYAFVHAKLCKYNGYHYKALGSSIYKDGGFAWRCKKEKLHISPTNIADNGEYQVMTAKLTPKGDFTVKWPTLHGRTYFEIMQVRKCLALHEWKMHLQKKAMESDLKRKLTYIRSCYSSRK